MIKRTRIELSVEEETIKWANITGGSVKAMLLGGLFCQKNQLIGDITAVL